jgi:CHAT domain-containing protein
MRRLAMRRAAPLLAAGAAIGLAAAAMWLLHVRDPLYRLKDAWLKGGQRPIAGRLAGFPYARAPVMRGGAMQNAHRPVGIGEEGRTTNAGVAELLAGNADKAVAILAEVVAAQPACATCRSDLSAAYMELAGVKGDPYQLVNALAEADGALAMQPDLPEGLFNRAAALEGLHIDAAAQRAWDRYLAVDPSSAWTAEAVARLAALRRARQPAFKSQISKLEAAVRADDEGRVAAIVRAFPQDARTYAETVFTAEWGEAELGRDRARAADRLALARMVAAAVRGLSGESMAVDAVEAIDRTAPDARLPLALAYLHYRDARRSYGKRDVGQSQSPLAQAADEFRVASSPMLLMAIYYQANAAYEAHDSERALALIASLRAATPPRYRALHASLHRIEGTVVGANGKVYESYDQYATAFREFALLGERANAADARLLMGSAWAALGDDRAAWSAYVPSLSQLSADGKMESVQKALTAAAHTEIGRGHWPAARALLQANAELNPLVRNPRLTSWNLLWLAVSASHVHAASYDTELARARESAALVPDPSLRADALDDVRVAASGIAAEKEPAAAVALISPSIEQAARNRREWRLPELLAIRARARGAMGDWRGAAADLRQATGMIEQRRVAIAPDDLRDAFLGTTESLYANLADALDHLGELSAAFDAAESGRARAILDRVGDRADGSASTPLPMAAISGRIPAGTLLVRFVPLPDRLLIVSISDGQVRHASSPIGSAALSQRTDQFFEAIHRKDSAAAQRLAAVLHEALLRPLEMELPRARRLVVVADASLARIPFAALFDPRRGRYLLEDRAVVTSLSATLFARNLGTGRPSASPRLLIVGDPDFDRERFPQLPSLLESAREARTIASLYRQTGALIGPDATVPAVTEQLHHCEVAHLAAHALVDQGDAHLSALLLTPVHGDGGMLHAGDLMKASLPQLRLVFLAGCSTSQTSSGYGDVRSLAAAFQMAGARNVIASLWDADDEVTRELTSRFYRQLAAGAAPAEALRTAQLALLQSPDPRLRETWAWSTFQLLGSGE